MRRWQVQLAAGVLLLMVSVSGAAHAQEGKAFSFDGEAALWTVAVRPDKTAEFEQVMTRLRAALAKSEKPGRRQQAAGWKVLRLPTALSDGNVAYVHLVHPGVAGADYTVMQILYDEFPEERQALYELYRGAFAKNLSLAVGTVAVDMSAVP